MNEIEDPEIPVSEEMSEAGDRAYALAPNDQRIALASAYCAMAALAPLKFDHTMMLLARAQRAAAQQRITSLEAENDDLRDKLNRKSEAAVRDVDDKNATIARLKGELAEEMTSHTSDVLYYDRMVDLLEAKLAAFTSDPQTQQGSSDIPDPPRRADGTLAPQPKPWTPPKANGDARRIGG